MSTRYLALMPVAPPQFLERDVNFRVYWVCNFQVIKSESATLGADIAAYLAAASPSPSLGVVGTSIFYNSSPDAPSAPDSAIFLYEYGGAPDEPDMGANSGTVTRLEYPRLQVMTRGAREDSTGPRRVIQQVKTKLMLILGTTL